MKLSICICTVSSRREMFLALKNYLLDQFSNYPVEMCCHDADDLTTGEKRDRLLSMSSGEYVCFIDDDDMVPEYYVDELYIALRSNPDCVPVDGVYTRDGENPIAWRMSKDFPNATIWEDGKQVFLRPVNHIAAVKRSIAMQVGFPDISNGEDKAYAEGIAPLLKTEVKIARPMYEYRFSSFNKLYK